MALRARALVVLSLALGLRVSAARAEAPPARARLVPPLEGPNVTLVGTDRDGARRLISYRLRLLAHPDGSLTVADEFLPVGRDVEALELPARLGGGFLFSVTASGSTSLWRAARWAAPLVPFARLDFELQKIVPGFDRVYVQARRGGLWAALDPETGAGLDRGGLPSAPGYAAMAFADAWFGAVQVPVRGTLVTFDAGASWQPLGRATLDLSADAGALSFTTREGRLLLGSDGEIRSFEARAPSGRAPTQAAERRVLPASPFGGAPLALAARRGIPEGKDAALVASGGALARVSLIDGRVLAQRDGVLPEGTECTGVELGRGFGFVCGEPSGATGVYAPSSSLELGLVTSFETPRVVVPSGNGALAVIGGCDDAPSDAETNARFCVVPRSGARFEVASDVPAHLARVVVLGDGRAAVISPPRAGKAGSLHTIDARGAERALALRLDERDEKKKKLLERGFWLEGLSEAEGGILGWVVTQRAFVGVRVGLDGRVKLGEPRQGVERAAFSGRRALWLGPTGAAEQTLDGGFQWKELALPNEIELDAKKVAPGAGLEQGCSLLGCGFLGWVRLGWQSVERLAVAREPEPTSLPSPGGARWRLECRLSGEVSRPALPLLSRQGSGPKNALSAQAPWMPLLEAPPPRLPAGGVGFDTGPENELIQLRAYGGAPDPASFPAKGWLEVRVADRFRAVDGLWSTAPSPSPWLDVHEAAQAFGYEGSSPSMWRLVLDPSGRAGVLSVIARGTTELFGLESGRPIQRLINAARADLGIVASAVRLLDAFYVATYKEPGTLRIFALSGGGARLIGEYPESSTGLPLQPTLVRATRGEAIGLWVRGAGWHVFPIDLRTGVAERAIEIPAVDLASAPPPCPPDQEGYLVEGPVTPDPLLELEGTRGLSARRVEGRFVLSDSGICTEGLAAQADGAIDRRLRAGGAARRRASIPLVVTDRTEGGRRWDLECSR